MKDPRLEKWICEPYCRFYKGGREEMACAGLIFFRTHFDRGELKALLQALVPQSWTGSEDATLSRILCDGCEFAEDGCGFREGEEDSPPCGGYILLEQLLRQNLLDRKAL